MPLCIFLEYRLVWVQTGLKEEVAAKTAAISLLEETVASLESTLEEKTEEWQAALEYLEDSYKSDKVRLEEQLSALSAEKVLSIPAGLLWWGLMFTAASFSQWTSKLSTDS